MSSSDVPLNPPLSSSPCPPASTSDVLESVCASVSRYVSECIHVSVECYKSMGAVNSVLIREYEGVNKDLGELVAAEHQRECIQRGIGEWSSQICDLDRELELLERSVMSLNDQSIQLQKLVNKVYK